MTAVPARVAGVARIAVVTPDPADATLVVARELGVDEVYAIGGAQAVAALAFGTASIPAVDAIVRARQRLRDGGEAPRLEPRADRSACRPERGRRDRRLDRRRGSCRGRSPRPGRARRRQRCAAPHPGSGTLAEAVAQVVADHANVRVERVGSVDEALARSEAYAPEHLELHVADPTALASRVRNAGSVFVGCSSVIGDYAAGATHVLPTGGLARSTGGLGLETFLKPLADRHRRRRGSAPRRRGRRAPGPRRGTPAARCRRARMSAVALAREPRR